MTFDVCGRCGEYTPEPVVDGDAVVCPHCGYRARFLRLPLFFVTGASASGKSGIGETLRYELRDACVVLDHDVLWKPEFRSPETKFAAFRKICLGLAAHVSQSGRPLVLCGTTLPDQNEPLPERRFFGTTHYLGLVADEEVLARRLLSRPAWRDSAEPEFVATMRAFNQWLKDHAHETAPPITLLDTSRATIDESAREAARWVRARL